MSVKKILFLVSLAFPLSSHADFSGKVTRVIDGGQIVVSTSGRDVVVNLRSIMTPFPNQNIYSESRIIFENIFVGKTVKVVSNNKLDDRCVYGEVYNNNVNLNEALLLTGFAWIYNPDLATQRYKDIQAINASEKIGLWNEDFYFRFNDIPHTSSYLFHHCFVKGMDAISEKDQIAFYNEKEKYGIGLWFQVFVISLLIGAGLWFLIFWYDNQGFDLFKHFRKKDSKKGD